MLGARLSFVGTLLCALGLGNLGCGSDSNDSGSAKAGTAGTAGKTSAGTAGKTGTGTAGKTGTGDGGSAGTGTANPGGPPTTTGMALGDAHQGLYHLGPVDFAETQWHNACAPGGMKYRAELQDSVGLGGEYLAGVANAFNLGGSVCDACILIETGKGKSIVARVVTYGVEQADGDIDVSPNVFNAIYQNEEPRKQTWHFTHCPDEGNLQYEFQTAANPYWTSLWVRNPSLPLLKAEVKTATGKDFVELARAGDGTLTDPSGFGTGAFTFRFTAMAEAGMPSQVITDDQPSFKAGALVKSSVQFQ